jgi:hypothetical protein
MSTKLILAEPHGSITISKFIVQNPPSPPPPPPAPSSQPANLEGGANIGINTDTNNVNPFGGGEGVIAIVNAMTIPNPTTPFPDGGILYVSDGALYFLGGSGSVTMIANA